MENEERDMHVAEAVAEAVAQAESDYAVAVAEEQDADVKCERANRDFTEAVARTRQTKQTLAAVRAVASSGSPGLQGAHATLVQSPFMGEQGNVVLRENPDIVVCSSEFLKTMTDEHTYPVIFLCDLEEYSLGEEYPLGKTLGSLGTQQDVCVQAKSIGKRYISANRYTEPFVRVSMGKKYKVLVALANGRNYNWKEGKVHLIGCGA